jgi:hypothetical protein
VAVGVGLSASLGAEHRQSGPAVSTCTMSCYLPALAMQTTVVKAGERPET